MKKNIYMFIVHNLLASTRDGPCEGKQANFGSCARACHTYCALPSSVPLQKNCSHTSETAQTQCCNARAQALLPAVVSQTLAVWVQSKASGSESGSRGCRGRVGVVSSTQTPSHGSVSCELLESNIAMGHTKSRK